MMNLSLTCFAYSECSIQLVPHDLPMRPDILPVLRIASLGHALHAFVNVEYVGKCTIKHNILVT